MLQDLTGKKIRATRLTLAQVKRQFDKAGHIFTGLKTCFLNEDMVLICVCECGAKLRMRRDGKLFSRLEVFEPVMEDLSQP